MQRVREADARHARLDDLIELWPAAAASGVSLSIYLGLTEAEYTAYVRDGVLPSDYEPPHRRGLRQPTAVDAPSFEQAWSSRWRAAWEASLLMLLLTLSVVVSIVGGVALAMAWHGGGPWR